MYPESSPNEAFDYQWDQPFSFSAFNSPSGREWLEPVSVADTTPSLTDDQPTLTQASQFRQKLGFLPQSQWWEDGQYIESPPKYIHYTIEWKVTVNNRAACKDTGQDIVLAPHAYWQSFLKPKLEAIVSTRCSRATPLDTSVKICINDRGERDVTKRFDSTDVDWALVEKQLIMWSELFRAGKRLTLIVSFNYKNEPQTNLAPSEKRARVSTTKRMLTERAIQLDAEETSCGHDPTWRYVYDLMRCKGPPCNLGPHCWIDPNGKKHHVLRTHYLKELIKFVDNGGTLASHDDVPQGVRNQLYAESQQSKER